MSGNYYELISFVFNHEEHFCIWCDPDEGEPYFEQVAQRLYFESEKQSVIDYIAKHKYSCKNESRYDFDEICCTDYDDYLNKWNIIDDLAASLKINFAGREDDYDPLYKKYVCACNLPALNTSGKAYVPSFDEDEKEQIVNLTKDMCRILEIVFSGKN